MGIPYVSQALGKCYRTQKHLGISSFKVQILVFVKE